MPDFDDRRLCEPPADPRRLPCQWSLTARLPHADQNLSQDFNCFIVGDATMATFPANDSPAFATNAAISFASLDQMITECGWITLPGEAEVPAPRRRGARL